MWNSAWNKLQLKISQVTYVWLVQLDEHLTFKTVMVSVVGSTPLDGNFIFCSNFLKPLDVKSGLKCKFDLIVNIYLSHCAQTNADILCLMGCTVCDGISVASAPHIFLLFLPAVPHWSPRVIFKRNSWLVVLAENIKNLVLFGKKSIPVSMVWCIMTQSTILENILLVESVIWKI